jgi:hypothetical protein
MKVLHGAWSCSLKQINKGTIKVFDTPYIKVLQVLLESVFHDKGIANKVDYQSNTKFLFNLDTFNASCTQVHKTKMNAQYPL